MFRIKRYCLPSIIPMILVMMIGILFDTLLMIGIINTEPVWIKLVTLVFFLGILAAFAVIAWRMYIRYAVLLRKRLKHYAKTEMTELMKSDFKSAERRFKKNLKTGKSFIFGKSNGNLLRYSDIDILYRNLLETTYTYSNRVIYTYSIKVVSSRDESELCIIPNDMAESDEWYKLCDFLAEICPTIEVRQEIVRTFKFVDDSPSKD